MIKGCSSRECRYRSQACVRLSITIKRVIVLIWTFVNQRDDEALRYGPDGVQSFQTGVSLINKALCEDHSTIRVGGSTVCWFIYAFILRPFTYENISQTASIERDQTSVKREEWDVPNETEIRFSGSTVFGCIRLYWATTAVIKICLELMILTHRHRFMFYMRNIYYSVIYLFACIYIYNSQ